MNNADIQKKIKEISEHFKVNKTFGEKKAPQIQGVEYLKNCIVCNQELPPNLARTCSGDCYLKDKERQF
jgi:hypothetical protein